MLSFSRAIPPIVPGRRVSSWASEWCRPAEMSWVGSAVGAAMEAEPRGEADELAEGPADAEGAVVRAEGGVAVAVALPQAATRVVARAAPSNVRIVALERRIIRLPRSSEMPRPLGIAAA